MADLRAARNRNTAFPSLWQQAVEILGRDSGAAGALGQTQPGEASA